MTGPGPLETLDDDDFGRAGCRAGVRAGVPVLVPGAALESRRILSRMRTDFWNALTSERKFSAMGKPYRRAGNAGRAVTPVCCPPDAVWQPLTWDTGG